MRRVAVALLALAVVAPAAGAATTATTQVYDSRGRLIQTQFAPLTMLETDQLDFYRSHGRTLRSPG